MAKPFSKLFPKTDPATLRQSADSAAGALVAAQAAIDRAQLALDAAHDSDSPEAVLRAEADLVAARAERDRAEARQRSIQRRLSDAQAGRQAEDRAAGIKRLRAACKERSDAAAAIDGAFEALGAAVEQLNAADVVLLELQSAGIVPLDCAPGSNFGTLRTRVLLDVAAFKHGMPGAYVPGFTRSEAPTTVAAVEADNATAQLGLQA